MCVLFYSAATRLFHLEPKSLGNEFTMLHVVLRIGQPKETHVFLMIISNFLAKSFCITKNVCGE